MKQYGANQVPGALSQGSGKTSWVAEGERKNAFYLLIFYLVHCISLTSQNSAVRHIFTP